MSVVEEIALRQSIRFGLLVVGLVAAAIYAFFFCHRPPSIWKTVVKAVPMPAFAAAVAVSFGSVAVVIALVLSAIGDIALSREGEKAFLTGLVSFALAHVVYIFIFWELSGGFTGATSLLVALGLVALSTEIWLRPFTGALRWPVRIYVGLICTMGAAALGLSTASFALLGALAFMASDTLLAIQLFRMQPDSQFQRLVSMALWVLYAGGQFLIVSGVAWSTPLF